MQGPSDILGVLADVFSWAGFVGAAVFGILALVLRLADGTWLPARAVVESVEGGRVVRWIDADGGVNEAPLTGHDLERVGDREMADIHYRRGWSNRMRLVPGSPAVRVAVRLAIALAGLGAASFVGGWMLLALRG
ncbi:MAG: hypothetical protein QM602_10100 [Microbacterium sp.]